MALSPGRSAVAPSLRRAAWSVPEWPWIALVGGAWALAGPGMHGLGHGAWVAMVVAMMLPATIPVARSIALEGLWSRRYRAPAIFLAAYVAVWSLFGAIALAAWGLAEPHAGSPHRAIALILLVGAGWQVTRRHLRCLKRCHRRRPIGLRGRAADLACARYGVYHARQCCGTCWPLMLAMVPAHLPALMLALTALSTWQRLARRPRRDVAVAALAGLAVLMLVR